MYQYMLYVIAAMNLLNFMAMMMVPNIPFLAGWFLQNSFLECAEAVTTSQNIIIALWAMTASRGLHAARWALVIFSIMYVLYTMIVMLDVMTAPYFTLVVNSAPGVILCVVSILGAINTFARD